MRTFFVELVLKAVLHKASQNVLCWYEDPDSGSFLQDVFSPQIQGSWWRHTVAPYNLWIKHLSTFSRWEVMSLMQPFFTLTFSEV